MDGTYREFTGQFAAFLNPAATDHSLLGRDILDSFDVIVGRQQGEIQLLAGVHFYEIRSP
jgi:hypothetical protein